MRMYIALVLLLCIWQNSWDIGMTMFTQTLQGRVECEGSTTIYGWHSKFDFGNRTIFMQPQPQRNIKASHKCCLMIFNAHVKTLAGFDHLILQILGGFLIPVDSCDSIFVIHKIEQTDGTIIKPSNGQHRPCKFQEEAQKPFKR